MSNSSDYINQIFSLSLDRLKIKHGMCIRSYNVCINNELTTLGSLLDYYYKNRTFRTLPKVGNKTNRELLGICVTYLADDQIAAHYVVAYKGPYEQIYNSLTGYQVEIVNLFIAEYVKKLSIRAINVLNRSFNDEITFRKIQGTFLSNKEMIAKTENVGYKTNIELLTFVNAIESYTLDLSAMEMDDAAVRLKHFIINLSNTFLLPHSYLDPYMSSIQNQQFQLFAFIQQLLFDYKLLNEREISIMRMRPGYFTGREKKPFASLSDTLGITKERVRQITSNLDNLLSKRLAMLNHFKTHIHAVSTYPIGFFDNTIDTDCIYITEKQAAAINKAEGCFFTPKFIHLILNSLHADTHVSFSYTKRFHKHLYSIHRELMAEFDFAALLNSIVTKTSNYIKKTETINYAAYLRPFLKQGLEASPRVKKVCKTLIECEFTEGVTIDAEGHLIFENNNKKRNKRYAEYIIETLEKHNEPMTLEDIMQTINAEHTELIRSITHLRSVVTQAKAHIISLGRRSGYFGLSRWQKERGDLKKKRIKDHIDACLMLSDTPQHITEILAYVQQHRPNTNITTIDTLLHLYKPHVCLFSKGFWGLTDKTYGDTQFNRQPSYLFSNMKRVIAQDRSKTETEIVEFMVKTYDLQAIQVTSLIEKRIQLRNLKREDDKLVVVPQTRKMR